MAGSRPATSARSMRRGYVTIVGRSKDLIISGGYNVYPAEIEGYINEMPGVAESAVVGLHTRISAKVSSLSWWPKPGPCWMATPLLPH